MDTFSLLPPNVFLEIFHYLPFKDRVRVERVNKTFQQMSTTAISDTESFEFSAGSGDFIKLSPGSFSKLINLCSNNLESVDLYPVDRETKEIMEMVKIFSQISFPNLTELYLGYYVNKNIDTWEPLLKSEERDEIFANIIRRNPNLKKLEIHRYAAPFPSDVVCENLEHLKIGLCGKEIFNSLIGRCPNLQDVLLWFTFSPSPDTYSKFFAGSPKIRRLWGLECDFGELNAVDSFWRLPLIDLSFSLGARANDDTMVKIAASFPHLECLFFTEADFGGRGLAALKSLKCLKELHLAKVNGGIDGTDVHLDDELRSLALECPSLETVEIHADISITTLKMIVQFCPKIQDLRVSRIVGVYTVDDARSVAESLARVENRKLKVCLDYKYVPWKSEEIKEILSNLGSDIGQSVQIGW